MLRVDALFEGEVIIGVPSLCEEYGRKTSGAADNQAGDKCD